MLSLQALYVAYKQVKKNRGAAGIDGQSIDDFTQNLEKELNQLLLELKEKRYQAQPVKRVEIDKYDGGKRLLGIPTVRDRIVQQCLSNIMTPIFDPQFHPSSYGYRIGRSCHQAISKATLFVRRYNKRHVVDMDLSKCFDMLNHDLIIKFVRKRITDGSILNLIDMFLKSGVMVDSAWQKSELGSPQGGVISPLLANIYLDEFDQEMMKRKHRIVRYADDILIFCTSKSGADNALKVASHILEVTLKLKVNERKTHIAHSDTGIKFLGVVIGSNFTRIQEKKLNGFKVKVKQMTKRNGGGQFSDGAKAAQPSTKRICKLLQDSEYKLKIERTSQLAQAQVKSSAAEVVENAGKTTPTAKAIEVQTAF